MRVVAAAAPAATLDAAASTEVALATMAAACVDHVDEATTGAATGAGPTDSINVL
jgi:hypothetical protein